MSHIHILSRRTILKGAAAIPATGLGLAALSRSANAQGDPIKVGSKDFPEQFILANIFGQVLENAGLPVNLDNINLGGTGIANTALMNGDIDLYAEYTGTAYTFDGILNREYPPEGGIPAATASAATPVVGTPVAGTPIADSSGFTAADLFVYDAVVAGYAALGIVALHQTPFNDNQAIAVTRAFSEENGITTMSQLGEWGQDNAITISAPVDFESESRKDGIVAIRRVYGAGYDNATVNGVDPGLKYDAIISGDANVVLAFGTDAEILQYDLVVLQDDRGLFPPGHAVPVVRQQTIDAYPNIPDLLNPIVDMLTNDAMVSLNSQVVTDGGEPADVAKKFLVDSGIISG